MKIIIIIINRPYLYKTFSLCSLSISTWYARVCVDSNSNSIHICVVWWHAVPTDALDYLSLSLPVFPSISFRTQSLSPLRSLMVQIHAKLCYRDGLNGQIKKRWMLKIFHSWLGYIQFDLWAECYFSVLVLCVVIFDVGVVNVVVTWNGKILSMSNIIIMKFPFECDVE